MTELPIDENTPRILIVEDEPKLGQLLIDYLRAASYAPTLISHGDQVLPYVRQTPPDLILLDLMLPGTDGLTLCREIRRFSDIPIVMVTAKIEEIDRLLGLEIGADDYICKPYSPREVVARVKTILRRCKPQRELQQQDAESPLIIDEGRFQASWRGKMLDLTPAEFRLLKTLSHEPGKVFSREQLLNHLYDDYRVVTDRTIDSHIKNLRRKLESLDAEQSFIRAVYGVGYRWEADACREERRRARREGRRSRRVNSSHTPLGACTKYRARIAKRATGWYVGLCAETEDRDSLAGNTSTLRCTFARHRIAHAGWETSTPRRSRGRA